MASAGPAAAVTFTPNRLCCKLPSLHRAPACIWASAGGNLGKRGLGRMQGAKGGRWHLYTSTGRRLSFAQRKVHESRVYPHPCGCCCTHVIGGSMVGSAIASGFPHVASEQTTEDLSFQQVLPQMTSGPDVQLRHSGRMSCMPDSSRRLCTSATRRCCVNTVMSNVCFSGP